VNYFISPDIATMTLTLHHFDRAGRSAVLSELARVARRLVIINDLERNWPNYVGARILAVAGDYDGLQRGLVTNRCLSTTQAQAFIVDGRGKRYDPQVVDAFVDAVGVTAAQPAPALENMRTLASLLRIHDEAVRGVMQDWLHGVYAVESTPGAADRQRRVGDRPPVSAQPLHLRHPSHHG